MGGQGGGGGSTGGGISLGGMDPSQVYDKLQAQGVSPHDAATLVANWILTNVGQTQRSFSYQTAFPDTDPTCKPKFSRSFKHQDWIDGESVVQAGKTTAEEGFNERLHRIENDLDALATDTATALTCIGDLRKSMASILTEIQTAINLTNGDVYQCCAQRPTVPVTPGFTTGTMLGQSEFLGTTKFFEQNVTVWKTPQGLAMMPAVSTVNIGTASNPSITQTADFASFIATNADVAGAFGAAGMTKEQFIQRFGGTAIGGGRTVKDLVATLPDGSHYASADAMLTAVATGEAAAIRATGGTGSLVAGSFQDLGAGITTISNAPIEKFQALPAETRKALLAAGIDTVGKLGGMNAQQLREILTKGGVTISAGEAAAMVATAKTLGMVR